MNFLLSILKGFLFYYPIPLCTVVKKLFVPKLTMLTLNALSCVVLLVLSSCWLAMGSKLCFGGSLLLLVEGCPACVDEFSLLFLVFSDYWCIEKVSKQSVD